MNGKTQILAVAAVVVMVAAAFVGIGYAYQASFSDTGTSDSTVTGQYLTVTDSITKATNAVDLDAGSAKALKLYIGTDETKNANSTYTRAWNITDPVLNDGTSDLTKDTNYSISLDTNGQIVLKVLYCLGTYDVKAPEEITTGAVKVVATAPAVSVEDTPAGIQNVSGGSTVATGTGTIFLSASQDVGVTAISSETTVLSPQTFSTTAKTYYVYCLMNITIGAPTANEIAPAITLDLTANTTAPVVTANTTAFA